MKLSVSLPDEDVEFIDAYAQSQGIASRSAVVHKAVRLLKAHELGAAYEDAWEKLDTRRRRCRVGRNRQRWSDLMRRGEIRLVDLAPVRGAEAAKRRPGRDRQQRRREQHR